MTTEANDIPFYLMPVAAVFGMYTIVGSIRAVYLLYANLKTKEGDIPPATSLKSKAYSLLVISVLLSAVAYAKVVAMVENAVAESDHALFDPYDILKLPDSTTNTTVIKQAYRELSKKHHPDKGGSEAVFHKINLAYRALTDDKENWQRYGHPDGPVQTHSLTFALPEWLLHPEGKTAAILLVLYLGMFVGLIYWVIRYATTQEQKATKLEMDNSVAGADLAYLASNLSPDSSPFDILCLIATTPENMERTQQSLDKAEQLKKEKLQKRSTQKDEFDLGGGWADDDEEEDTAAAEAKMAKERAERIANATGTKEVLMEGVDEGVLGQQWVQNALAKKQQWPPKHIDVLKGRTYKTKDGKVVDAMEHPAIRRNLCMTMGRLNAPYLNTHPELLEAGSKKLVDGTYFSSTIEYRNRVGMLLEASLRIAMQTKSYRLAKTIIETVVMFKIGTVSVHNKNVIKEFQQGMMKKYGGEDGVPKLSVNSCRVYTPDEEEIATEDTCALEIDMERLHAENFTKQKVQMCQEQGIPVQVALKSYREGWWILVRAKRTDGKEKVHDEEDEDLPDNNSLLAQALRDGVRERFSGETGENRLVTAWPLIVQNVSQKGGKLNVRFRAPSEPGKYRYFVAIKSQEFLGADQEHTVDAVVVDAASITRVEDEVSDGEEEGDEGKKEK